MVACEMYGLLLHSKNLIKVITNEKKSLLNIQQQNLKFYHEIKNLDRMPNIIIKLSRWQKYKDENERHL